MHFWDSQAEESTLSFNPDNIEFSTTDQEDF